jgi:phosphoglycerate dehydrogenase-like enzyme
MRPIDERYAVRTRPPQVNQPTQKENSMAKLAFLGLGQMGTPMAARLLEAGHDLTVWQPT